MKKLIGIVVLFILVVPVRGTQSQTGDEPAINGWEPGQALLQLLGTQPTAVPKPVPDGQNTYLTHPEFTGIMTTTVTTAANDVDDGYLFVSPLGGYYAGPSAIMILDNAGEPVYINTFPGEPVSADFKKQTVNGIDYLTYQTTKLPDGNIYGYSVVLDENYQVVDTWTMNDGFADVHDFILLDNGHAILMAYTPIPFDLSPYGGPVDGNLLDVVLEEQDENKNVVFEWRATEHLPIHDSELDLDTTELIDFLHTNAIEVDDDGNWLLSHRHFSEVTKISRQTGEIIWRMGGAGNEFTFTNDIGFSNQHDIRRLENGNITIFDNGNNHNPSHSRAIEYAINEVTKIVTRVWVYPGDTSEYAFAMGNNQRLPNGNSMIGWGTEAKLTEVKSDGSVALEMLLGSWNYRAFRFPWSGVPLDPPRAIVQYGADPTAVTLYTSWNGATDIVSYQVYAGPTTATMAVVDTAPRTGFETEIELTGLPSDTCFFQTKPVQAQADPTPFSNMTFRADLAVCREQLNLAYEPFMTR